MKRMFWATALVGALVLASAAPVAAADPMRPFSGHDEAISTFIPPTTCPEGALWRMTGTGSGWFLHLGHASVSLTHCTFGDFVSGTGTFREGVGTLAAANGDKLHIAYTGTWNVVMTPAGPAAVFEIAWGVTGGTGRLAGATGAGTAHGSGLLSEPSVTASYEGAIAY